jgi:hypothetical protein
MSRRFRVVFVADSSLRLHEKPGHPPMTWRFPRQIDGEQAEVVVRDLARIVQQASGVASAT